jgi:hypothetical protein
MEERCLSYCREHQDYNKINKIKIVVWRANGYPTTASFVPGQPWKAWGYQRTSGQGKLITWVYPIYWVFPFSSFALPSCACMLSRSVIVCSKSQHINWRMCTDHANCYSNKHFNANLGIHVNWLRRICTWFKNCGFYDKPWTFK